jgi:hypothetical protein
VVARDVSQWVVSPDARAWYWLAGYNYDVAGAPAGTLQTAPFPDGAAPATLATGVGDFAPVTDTGLWLRTGVTAAVGTLGWMADRAAPAAVAPLDTNVLTVLDAAADGGRFLYAKTFAPVRPDPVTGAGAGVDLVDLYADAPGAAAPCVVAGAPAALHAALSPAGTLVVWDRSDTLRTSEQGVATALPACAATPFATGLRGLLPAGPDAYAYLDDAGPSSEEATLRYAHVVNGALAAGTQIQTRAAPVFAPLAPALPAAVAYTVATGTSADGLYVYVDPGAGP